MITVAILTISDRGAKGERDDTSGPLISELLKSSGARVDHYEIIPDEKELIKEKLLEYSKRVDLILTTGGTGLAPRDVTPDATLEIIDREVSGIAEIMRSEGFKKTKRAILSRAVAGIKGKTLIINLPGSPKAVKEGLEIILDIIPHAIEKIKGDATECAIP
ncbi:MAG: MogA/MoaB family molybdenum cofactor biosynthesis protein [Thermodesulfovibrionales bacterium]